MDVSADVTIAAPRERVWRALRDPEVVARWHGWDYPGLANEVREIFVDGAIADREAGTIDVGAGVFTVEALDDARTRVTVARLAAEDSEFHAIDEGWITFVQQLRFMVERHEGEDRRTVRVTGDGGDPDDAIALLDDAESDPWFRSPHQQGLVVPAYGDGLAIIARTPSGGGAVVTTYGLDDDGFAAVKRHWASFWNERFTEVKVETA